MCISKFKYDEYIKIKIWWIYPNQHVDWIYSYQNVMHVFKSTCDENIKIKMWWKYSNQNVTFVADMHWDCELLIGQHF